MTEWDIAAIIIFLFLIEIIIWHKKKKKLVGICFNVCTGLLALFPVSYLLSQAGISLPVNLMTGTASAVLGPPGVALLSGVVFVASWF